MKEIDKGNSKAEAGSAAAAALKPSEVAETAAPDAATDADATDSEDDGGMTSLEYITVYKQLPPHEVELILEKPVERAPFSESQACKDLNEDPSATEADFEDALVASAGPEGQVPGVGAREYEANGYIVVSDEYIARRARVEQVASEMWKEAFADFGKEEDEGSD